MTKELVNEQVRTQGTSFYYGAGCATAVIKMSVRL